MSKPKVVVVVEGGVVQNVITNHDCELMVIDYDTDGVPEDELYMVKGNEAYLYTNGGSLEVNPETVKELWNAKEVPVHIHGDCIEAIKGDVKVSLDWIGEGWCGDYEEDNPLDQKLMRFDVYKRLGDDWEIVEDASYCTRFPLDTPKDIKEAAVRHLVNEFYDSVCSEVSVKKLGERLSWISPDWFKKEAS